MGTTNRDCAMQLITMLLFIATLWTIQFANSAVVDSGYYSQAYGDSIDDNSVGDLSPGIEKRSSGAQHVWECKKKLLNGGYYQGGHDVDEMLRHCHGAHERADESGHTYGCHHSNEDGCYGDDCHDYGPSSDGGDGGVYKRRRRSAEKGKDVVISEKQSNSFLKFSDESRQ